MSNLNFNQAQQDVILSLFSPVIDAIAERVSTTLIQNEAKKEPKYYSRKETAKILHITLPTLARLTNDGLLSCKRIGSRILYDAESIDEAVKEKVVFKYRRATK